jgi:hypothetical protein
MMSSLHPYNSEELFNGMFPREVSSAENPVNNQTVALTQSQGNSF